MDKKDFHTSLGPYMTDQNSTTKIMRNLLIALLPIILFAFYKNGIIPFMHGKGTILDLFFPLIFILIPTITSFLAELCFMKFIQKKPKEELKEAMRHSYSLFPGIFLGLILPIHTPISILILGSIFATIVGKMLFGGFGNNIFNPALVGRLFIISTYAIVIGSSGGYLNAYEVDTISKATPLTNVAMVEGIGTYETLVAPYGNLWDFFIGTIPGSMGETSALLCLVAFVFLTWKRVIKWEIPVVYLFTVFGMTYMIGSINHLGIWYPLFQIFSGGLFFGAVFMATDPVTSPTTPIGKILYGLFLGILTVVFRYLTPLPEGVLTSILTMNMFVFILDRIGSRARFDFNKALILFVLAWLLILGIGTTIGNQYGKQKADENYQVVSKDTKGETVTYIATQKGFGGKIKAKIVIEKGTVKTYEILEQSDSYFGKLESANYMEELVKKQTTLEDVDTISGATVSSTAVKKLLSNTLADYRGGNGEDITPTEPTEKPFVKEEIEGGAVYTITKKSFGGDMKVKVTIISSMVRKVEVLEQHDSYYHQLEEANYLDRFQLVSDVSKVDTISGATVSSTTIKKIVEEALQDYRGA